MSEYEYFCFFSFMYESTEWFKSVQKMKALLYNVFNKYTN